MGWLRLHRRRWGWLALLALALQLGLAFGHVHVAHEGAPAAVVSGNVSHSDSGDRDNDYCATCAILALLSGAQNATAPTVPVPAVFASADVAIPGAPVRIGSPHAPFQSRAPPLS
jgi:hypothetical protein